MSLCHLHWEFLPAYSSCHYMAGTLFVRNKSTASEISAEFLQLIDRVLLDPVGFISTVSHSWNTLCSVKYPLFGTSSWCCSLLWLRLLSRWLHWWCSFWSERHEVIFSSTVAYLTWSPSYTHPVSWPFHVTNWVAL